MLLVLMTHDGDDGFGEMFFDEVRCETGPGGEVAFVDSFEPSGWDRVATGGVEKRDVFGLGACVVGAVGEGGGL